MIPSTEAGIDLAQAIAIDTVPLRTEGLSTEAKWKIRYQSITGATHTGAAGITQEPRTIRLILKILIGK